MIYFVLTFFLGTCVGSFVNVLIDRSVEGKDWIGGRSACDHCHKKLSWYDMIPILSWLSYRGKSRCCGKPLSLQYPIVEAIVGSLFVWWVSVGYLTFALVSAPLSVIQPGFWLVTGILLIILALADLFYGVVLMPVVWLGTVMTLVYRLTLWHYGAYQLGDLLNAIVVAALCFAFFWLLWRGTKGRGMAEGDMYVVLYLGILLGWPKGVVMLGLSFVLGAIVGIGLIASGLATRRDTMPFVPFMVVAAALSLWVGADIIRFVS
jgi:leader peptidase (prepilin peptidase)/N-methyltransferase